MFLVVPTFVDKYSSYAKLPEILAAKFGTASKEVDGEYSEMKNSTPLTDVLLAANL
jgi:hypothetical protein